MVVAIEESRKIARKPHSVVGQSAFDERAVADAMRKAGFATKDNDDDNIMLQYGRLLFDSDEEGASQGFQIPQEVSSTLSPATISELFVILVDTHTFHSVFFTSHGTKSIGVDS